LPLFAEGSGRARGRGGSRTAPTCGVSAARCGGSLPHRSQPCAVVLLLSAVGAPGCRPLAYPLRRLAVCEGGRSDCVAAHQLSVLSRVVG